MRAPSALPRDPREFARSALPIGLIILAAAIQPDRVAHRTRPALYVYLACRAS